MAVPNFCFPIKLTLVMREVVIPVIVLEPAELFKTLSPRAVRESLRRLEHVVLPLVPVTPIILSGSSIYLRKSGHILIATIPGKLVALCLVIFSAIIDSFAIKRAQKKRNLPI